MTVDRNVGGDDRTLRYGCGAVATFLGVVLATAGGRPAVGAVLALLGFWWVGTATARYCPVNDLLGVDTATGGEETREESESMDAGDPSG